MSRFSLPALACACALSLPAAPAPADDLKQQPLVIIGPVSPEPLLTKLRQKVDFDGDKAGQATLAAALQALARKHDIAFVILEEQFKAKKSGDIMGKKSRVQKLDTKGMSVAEFLDAWLPALGATYKVHPDYVAVVPLVRVNADGKDEPKPAKKGDATERILDALEQEAEFKEGSHITDIPLFDLLQDLSKQHNVTFIIMEEYFNAEGIPNVHEAKPRLRATQLRGLRLHQFLRVVLDSIGATYLVRNNAIEIVPVRFAAKVTKPALIQGDGETARTRLAEPLVSFIAKEKPLNAAVAKMAEMYDLTVAVSPQAGEARTAPVSARLLNVPADKALEQLALQADLRVVRRGSAYLITSKDQANEIFDEEQNKQRQRIELKKLREEKPAEKPAGLAPRPGVPFPGDVPLVPLQPVPGPKK